MKHGTNERRKKKQHTRFRKYADNERLKKIHSKYNNNNREKDFGFLFHFIFQRSVSFLFFVNHRYTLCYFFFCFVNFKYIFVSVSYLLIFPNNFLSIFLHFCVQLTNLNFEWMIGVFGFLFNSIELTYKCMYIRAYTTHERAHKCNLRKHGPK